MLPLVGAKESEEVVVRRIVRRMERYLEEVERQVQGHKGEIGNEFAPLGTEGTSTQLGDDQKQRSSFPSKADQDFSTAGNDFDAPTARKPVFVPVVSSPPALPVGATTSTKEPNLFATPNSDIPETPPPPPLPLPLKKATSAKAPPPPIRGHASPSSQVADQTAPRLPPVPSVVVQNSNPDPLVPLRNQEPVPSVLVQNPNPVPPVVVQNPNPTHTHEDAPLSRQFERLSPFHRSPSVGNAGIVLAAVLFLLFLGLVAFYLASGPEFRG